MKRLLIALTIGILLAPCASAFYGSNLSAFGGNGQDGPVTASGTETAVRFIDASTFTCSGTWAPYSGTRVNSSGPMTISGTINVGASISGPPAMTYNGTTVRGSGLQGGGPGGGGSAVSCWCGGSGGGFGGAGGLGGALNSGGITQYMKFTGGQPYSPFVFPGGSAGGAGLYSEGSLNGTGGKGGDAGGTIRFYSGKTITVSGQINCNGGAGGNAVDGGAGASGGGGGTGGLAILAAMQSITISGSNGIQVIGGAGGNGTNTTGSAGGGGGAGWAVLIAPTVTVSGSINTAGGAAGTNTGSTNPPTAGGLGQTLIIQRQPTLPVLGLLEDRKFTEGLVAMYPRTGVIKISSKAFDSYMQAYLKRSAL